MASVPSAHASAAPVPRPARIHKAALGMACGVLSGTALFALTAAHVAFGVNGLPLELLEQFFTGYDVSWRGAVVGLAWGFAVGFVDGWLIGFVHNVSVGVWTFVMRTRHDLAATRNFLDHI